MTKVKLLSDIFRRNKERVFIVDALMDKEYTYGKLYELSCHLAAFLKDNGIKKGDRLVVALPNSIEFLALYFAAIHLGVTVIPMNPKLTNREVAHIVQNSTAKKILTTADIAGRLRGEMNIDAKKLIIVELETKQNPVGFLGLIPKSKKLSSNFRNIKDNDIFVVSYTSGTTALPKGVPIKYKNFIGNGSLFCKTLGIDKDNRFYGVLPEAYMGGWYNLLMIPFLAEGSVVMTQAFNPALALSFWENAIRHNVNTLWMVPSIMSILLSLDRGDRGSAFTKKNVRLALVGTAPLPDGLRQKFEERYGIRLYENFALGETFFLTTNRPSLSRNVACGPVIDPVKIKIVDTSGKAAKEGQIVVRTPFHISGYFKDRKATGTLLKKGWVYTGDVGTFDEHGYLHVTGRLKDIIIKGGVNVSPAEVENVISELPEVKEVAVVGVPDALAGEEVAAFVKKEGQLSAEELIAHCSKNLASFKVPKIVTFVEDFPRSSTGKILKRELKRIG